MHSCCNGASYRVRVLPYRPRSALRRQVRTSSLCLSTWEASQLPGVFFPLARGTRQEFRKPGVAACAFAGGTVEQYLTTKRRAFAGPTEDPGPTARDCSAELMAVLVSRRSQHAGVRESYRWPPHHRLRSLVPQRVGLDLFYGRFQARLSGLPLRQRGPLPFCRAAAWRCASWCGPPFSSTCSPSAQPRRRVLAGPSQACDCDLPRRP
jgi:hypothetical protein